MFWVCALFGHILYKDRLAYIWASAWDFQQCGMCDQQSLRSACEYAQSDQSLCLSLEYSMIAKLLTEHHLRFLSLKGGCTGSSESTLVKMPHCWKSCVTAHIRVNSFFAPFSGNSYCDQIAIVYLLHQWQNCRTSYQLKLTFECASLHTCSIYCC